MQCNHLRVGQEDQACNISERSMNIGTIARSSLLLLLFGFANAHLEGRDRNHIHMSQHVFYRAVNVDGLSIFYREAGPKDAPHDSSVARASKFVADARASLLATFRSLSPCRA